YRLTFPRDVARIARRPMLQIFPQLAHVDIDYAWGGTLAITRSRLPHFEQVAPGVLSAGGYSGHGVALATLAGEIIADAVGGTMDRFDLMAGLPTPAFPGGTLLRWPGLVLGMTWFALRDRL
ncbi:MAG: FAD-dependent oxidoreductase, partial [Pseudomonadota bacterium]